jgi:hypothetical protein
MPKIMDVNHFNLIDRIPIQLKKLNKLHPPDVPAAKHFFFLQHVVRKKPIGA